MTKIFNEKCGGYVYNSGVLTKAGVVPPVEVEIVKRIFKKAVVTCPLMDGSDYCDESKGRPNMNTGSEEMWAICPVLRRLQK